MIIYECIKINLKGGVMDFCNGVEGFNNFIQSNMRNISGSGIRCLCKNKKFLDPDVVMMYFYIKKKVQDHGRKDDWVNF